MLVPTRGHFDHEFIMTGVKRRQLSVPSQRFRMARITGFPLRGNGPERVEFSVFSEEMLPAKNVRRHVPNPHSPLDRWLLDFGCLGRGRRRNHGYRFGWVRVGYWGRSQNGNLIRELKRDIAADEDAKGMIQIFGPTQGTDRCFNRRKRGVELRRQ